MTTLGPDHFFACPHCNVVLRRATYSSGNTFGSTLWSDGCLQGPMMPKAVVATRCPSCSNAFLIEDGKDLGEHEWGEESAPVSYNDSSRVSHADADALAEIAANTHDPDRLRQLCIAIWHAQNHGHRRKDGEATPDRSIEFEENLERLVGLLGNDKAQAQLMKAEALRELGRHGEAIAVLQDIDSTLSWAADQIRSMATAGKTEVGVLIRPRR